MLGLGLDLVRSSGTLHPVNGMWFDGVNDEVAFDTGSSAAGYFGAGTVRLHVMVAAYPGSFSVIMAHGASAYRVYINSSGELLLNASGTAQYTLVVNTEYSIEIDYNSSGDATALRINGADQGITTVTAGPATTTTFELGSRQSGLNFNGVIWGVEVPSANGGKWLGQGTADADWTDQTNSNDLTVTGTPNAALWGGSVWTEVT